MKLNHPISRHSLQIFILRQSKMKRIYGGSSIKKRRHKVLELFQSSWISHNVKKAIEERDQFLKELNNQDGNNKFSQNHKIVAVQKMIYQCINDLRREKSIHILPLLSQIRQLCLFYPRESSCDDEDEFDEDETCDCEHCQSRNSGSFIVPSRKEIVHELQMKNDVVNIVIANLEAYMEETRRTFSPKVN